MAEGVEQSVPVSTPATEETSAATATATATATPAENTQEATSSAESSTPKAIEEESPSSGDKRKADDGGDEKVSKTDASTVKAAETNDAATTEDASPVETKPKKARIAMPPPVSSSLMDTEKYKLECPPPEDNTNEADVTKKITTANLMLFGLHPLIKEGPLRKMLEDYGTVEAITVRSAFASRYGHVSFGAVEEARRCYVAIHGAKLLHKTFLVQPSMAAPKATPKPTGVAVESPSQQQQAATVTDSAGAAAAAATAAAALTTSASG